MLHPTRTRGRAGLGAAGSATVLVATLLLSACGETTSPLSPEVSAATFAASPNSGAVVNTDVVNVPAVDPTNPGSADALPDIRGTATAKCVAGKTQISVHMTGLRPKGVYTIWIVTFESPGFDGTFDHLTGVGALGGKSGAQPNDGYLNVFTASASGVGQLTRAQPAGDLSIVGDVPTCLTDEADLFEFHVVGNYHADGATQGAFPAPLGPTTGWDEFAFIFVN